MPGAMQGLVVILTTLAMPALDLQCILLIQPSTACIPRNYFDTGDPNAS